MKRDGTERAARPDKGETQTVSPSLFMRRLRPEYYSDSERTGAYVLNAAALEYHLESITSRNETHDFEVFCRKLCERTICPNLRPQTGPDGGGDSKTDTETYPVADEISGLTYVGSANAGRERWAFAFSAMATWAAKVRNDVKEIAATGRAYHRIICITSRFAKAKTRARLEDELSSQYGIPVTIHDRSWIVREIIENNRIDLAFNYLKVGEFRPDAIRLGPTDYSRAQQLADIERTIADPDAFHGMERQLATEALVAAKLSRALEHPRLKIDGRFTRAIRLAAQHGTYRQKLEAEYEQIWTAFWWFDDIAFLNTAYDAFQNRALKSNRASDLALLGNLHQLLVNCVVHGLMSRDECRYDDRTAKLRQALLPLADEPERPNNSLEARTELLRIELTAAMIARDHQALSTIWPKYAAVLDKAMGLGEFDAETLVRFIEAPAPFVGNDPAYNDLIEKLAAFVGARKSEGEGALILLRRAKSLDLSGWPDMVRWLGKAAVGLSKREYAPALIEATYLLSVAYRHARLPWASRASSISTAASIVIEGEEESQLPVTIVPTMKLWAWNALGLSHIPDFLFAIQLLNGLVPALSDESKAKVHNDLRQMDLALGCMFLNLSEDDLRRLERLPDLLEGLGLFTARIALLYTLGHTDVLRTDGSLPEEESDEAVRDLLSKLKSQPIAQSLNGPPLLNDDAQRIMVTTIVGMRVEVEIPDSRFIPVAESILASLEAFFATALDRATPHTERFRIAVVPGGDTAKPRITTNRSEHTSVVAWPPSLSMAQPGRQDDVRRFLLQVAAHVMGATCLVDDPRAFLEELCASESVLQRMMLVTLSQNSFSRVTSQRLLSLSEWEQADHRSYPLRQERRDLPPSALPDPEDETNSEAEATPRSPPKLSHHRQPRIRSVIDVHAWNEARWRGCGYPYPLRVPVMSLLFENSAPARKIFERWRARFGREDADEEIAVSIITNLPGAAPHHYCVQITARHPELDPNADNRPTIMTSRSTTMEPESSENLDRFLREYRRSGAYFLVPAVGITDTKFFSDLAIFKRRLVVKSAAEVEEHDLESMALRIRGLKFAS